MKYVSLTNLKRNSGKRKHGSQLTQDERLGLLRRLKEVREEQWKLTPHALDRLVAKEIKATREDIVSTIKHCVIIEYRIVHNERRDRYEERVILRAKAMVNRSYNLNVVFSLTTKRIVTVWINHFRDKHSSLDWSIYDKYMEVLGV